MKLNNLQDLFLDELKDMYSAESQIIKALPKMARQCTNSELKEALEHHLEQTRGQKERLEKIFEGLGQKAKAKMCKGMEGILAEGEEMLKQDADDSVMDAAIIAGGQRVEHYEMAAYGTLRTYAELLGLDDAQRMLQQTLDEEKEADQKLNDIAESFINELAMSGESEEGQEEENVEELGSGRRGVHVMHSDEEGDEDDTDETEMSGEEEEAEEDEGAFARGQGGSTTRGGGTMNRGNPGAKPTKRRNKNKENA